MAAEMCLLQLPALLSGEPGADFQPSPFFAEQLTAFELWLAHGSVGKQPPEQLPIVLQVLQALAVSAGRCAVGCRARWLACAHEGQQAMQGAPPLPVLLSRGQSLRAPGLLGRFAHAAGRAAGRPSARACQSILRHVILRLPTPPPGLTRCTRCRGPPGASEPGAPPARAGAPGPLPGHGRLGGRPGAQRWHLPLRAQAAADNGGRPAHHPRLHLGQDPGAGRVVPGAAPRRRALTSAPRRAIVSTGTN